MRKIGSLIVILLITVTGLGTAAAQDDKCFEKGGYFDTELQKCVIRTGIEINIKYPLEVTQYPFVEQTVDTFLTGIRSQYINDFVTMGAETFSPGPWGLYIDYELFQFSPDVLSINFTISDYTGGAHGNQYFQTYTFDLAQNRLLALTDVFVPDLDIVGTLAPIVQPDPGRANG